MSIWRHGGQPGFSIALPIFGIPCNYVGILTYLFNMAALEGTRKLLEEEIRLLRSKLLSIEEKFNALQKSIDFVSSKYDELVKQIQGSMTKW